MQWYSPNCDFALTNSGTWTGEKSFKIQAYNNSLYAQYTNNFILRNSSGTNRLTLTAAHAYARGACMTRLTLTQQLELHHAHYVHDVGH